MVSVIREEKENDNFQLLNYLKGYGRTKPLRLREYKAGYTDPCVHLCDKSTVNEFRSYL